MLFVFHLRDRPEAGELRKAIRPAHKEYLARVADRICVAGPLLSDDQAQMIGSLLVIDFLSRALLKPGWQRSRLPGRAFMSHLSLPHFKIFGHSDAVWLMRRSSDDQVRPVGALSLFAGGIVQLNRNAIWVFDKQLMQAEHRDSPLSKRDIHAL